MPFRWRFFWLLLALAAPARSFADPATFDLAGPTLEITVTRAGKTLPIAQAPNLAAGDSLWIKYGQPPGQSARYVLIAAFLRGATDPPPPGWFFASEPWKPRDSGGLRIKVPDGARQALVFLAPETGGDFKTLVKAVRGRPGAFVRASQDLNRANLDRSRLDAFLAAIHAADQLDPERLKTVAPLLARTLAMKLDSPCLQKPPEQQAPCLTQGQESLVLNDGHSASMAQTLTSGSVADLVQQLTAAPQAGAGAYSPYVGAVMDIVRILDTFHTAQFQYIPALATEQGETMSLLLNAPPAFQNPKSVLVAALPAVEPARSPPLRAVDPKAAYCADQTPLVLPVEGAPLVFSTAYARDLVLRLKPRDGKAVDLPLTAQADQGGFVADTAGLDRARLGEGLEGSVHGLWGFDAYSGPQFRLQTARAQAWQAVADDAQVLIAGREGAVRLKARDAACVETVTIQPASGPPVKAEWKSAPPDGIAVSVPPPLAKAGMLTVLVKPFGGDRPDAVAVRVFAAPSRLETFTIHAGDAFGVLKGDGLDQVAGLTLMGVDYRPDPFAAQDQDALPLYAGVPASALRLRVGEAASAKVALRDGRVLEVAASVAAPRPSVTLIAKEAQVSPSGLPAQIQLANPDDVARDALLTFSVHAQTPPAFSGDQTIEVATLQGPFKTTLTLASGLTLENAQVAVAVLDTGKAFNASASGPLRFRIVSDGVTGNWQPLATLVRLPTFRDLKCPSGIERPCKLSGANLFLVAALAGGPGFDHPVSVPDGFPGSVLSVPHPTAGRLYVKLRDDPSVVNPVTFPVKTSASPARAMQTQSSKP